MHGPRHSRKWTLPVQHTQATCEIIDLNWVENGIMLRCCQVIASFWSASSYPACNLLLEDAQALAASWQSPLNCFIARPVLAALNAVCFHQGPELVSAGTHQGTTPWRSYVRIREDTTVRGQTLPSLAPCLGLVSCAAMDEFRHRASFWCARLGHRQDDVPVTTRSPSLCGEYMSTRLEICVVKAPYGNAIRIAPPATLSEKQLVAKKV
mmetsp:Transcript_72653/g.120269  ORF Transcript_72653/g.120269 Transcript_72653/m.120269 type:complete len:209 (-) Transcript_72653:30-656(-)